MLPLCHCGPRQPWRKISVVMLCQVVKMTWVILAKKVFKDMSWMGATSDVIRHILAYECIRVWNYIDDIFACVESKDADRVF